MAVEEKTFRLRALKAHLADLEYQKKIIEMSDSRAYSNGRAKEVDELIVVALRDIAAWYLANDFGITDEAGKLTVCAGRSGGFDVTYQDLRRPGVFKAVEFHLSQSQAEDLSDYFGGRRVLLGSNYVDSVSAYTTVSRNLTNALAEIASLKKRVEELELAEKELEARYSDAND